MAQVVLDWDLSDQTTLINGSILFSSSYLIFPSPYQQVRGPSCLDHYWY